MPNMLANPTRMPEPNPVNVSLEGSHPIAGPVLFAKNSVSELRHWSLEQLTSTGQIPFPVEYCVQTDRYETKVWADILSKVGNAIARCDVVRVIGSESLCELESVQTLLHHHSGKPVELVRRTAFGGNDGCPSRSDDQSSAGQSRVTIVIGSAPDLRHVGRTERCTSLFIDQILWPAMFDFVGHSYVLPMTSGGWKQSHIAFRRLLEIETEMSVDETRSGLSAEAVCSSRPLCSIIAGLLVAVRNARSTVFARPPLTS